MYGHSTQTRIQDPPTDTDMAFSAPGTILYNGELTYKYLISSYRSLAWQNEYLGRISNGDLAQAASDGVSHATVDKKQGGFYSQLVWRFDEPGRWRVGARFDLLTQNSITKDGVVWNPYTVNGVSQPLHNMLQRYTAMLEFSPTEFSRFRLQYAFDRSRFLDGVQKNTSALLAIAISFALAVPAQAKTKLVVTYPYIRAIVAEIAKDQVDVTTLAKGDEDPHFVVPRPSFIGKLRQADLLIINGGSLEIGFVPPLIRQANNPKIIPGAEGFVDLSQAVELIEKPDKVSRSEGDIHPEGNPHFILDWHNVPPVARAIADALARTDRGNASAYQKNLDAFLARWKAQSEAWDKRAEPLRGKAIIQYHRLFDYFARRAGMKIVGSRNPASRLPVATWKS